jgi:hypothetical protein
MSSARACSSPTPLSGCRTSSARPRALGRADGRFAASKLPRTGWSTSSISKLAPGRVEDSVDDGSGARTMGWRFALTDVKDIFVADAWAGGPADPKRDCGTGRRRGRHDRSLKAARLGRQRQVMARDSRGTRTDCCM